MKKVTKQEFLKIVWRLIKDTDTCAFDAVLDTAEKLDLDPQTVAKIVNSDAALRDLIHQRAVALNNIKAENAIA